MASRAPSLVPSSELLQPVFELLLDLLSIDLSWRSSGFDREAITPIKQRSSVGHSWSFFCPPASTERDPKSRVSEHLPRSQAVFQSAVRRPSLILIGLCALSEGRSIFTGIVSLSG